jgi:hypothetical protein
MAVTWARTAPVVHKSDKEIEEFALAYKNQRAADKSTQADDALVEEVLAAYGKQ